jgi:gliding motility-associated-like protein
VPLTLQGNQLPSGGEIRWFYSENPGFNPVAGQGTLAGTTPLPVIPPPVIGQCPQVCPDLLMLFVNSCNGSGAEPDNEFFVFTSGSGFLASEIQMDFDAANTSSGDPNDNDINIGTNSCQIKEPDASLINQLRSGACNGSNLFPAGPGDTIPPDAIVAFFTSSNVSIDYDFSTFCASGRAIYIMQSSCRRTLGAFTNAANCTSGSRIRTQRLSVRNCPCADNLDYDRCNMANLDGEYVRDVGQVISTVANGGITRTAANPCASPEWEAFAKPDTTIAFEFQMPVSGPLCGKRLYFKAWVVPSDAACTNAVTNSVVLNIEGCPDFSITNAPAAVCSGNQATVSYNAVAGSTTTWSVQAPPQIGNLPGGVSNASPLVLTPTLSGNQPQTFELTLVNTIGSCSYESKTNIRVDPAPDATISGSTTICQGQSTVLSVNPGSGTQINWSTGETGNSITINTLGNYSVSVTSGSCSAQASVTVAIADSIKPNITGPSSLCQGASISLSAEAGFDSYQWSNGANSASISINTPGQYTVTVTKGNCSGSATVNIVQAAVPQVNVITNPPACAGESNASASLSITYPDSFSVAWSNGSSGNQIQNVPSGNYGYTITYANNCVLTGNVRINDPPLLLARFEIKQPGCQGVSDKGSIEITEVLNATAPINISFNGESPSQETFYPDLEEGNYLISITDAKGCRLDTSISIRAAESISILLPDSITTSLHIPVLLQPQISGADNQTRYLWSPPQYLSCINCSNPIANPTADILYILEAVNGAGCKALDSVWIVILPPFTVSFPQAFTPNGDGVNDRAFVLTTIEGVEVALLQIFNRWGQKVFEVNNVAPNNRQFGWDGQFNGEPAPMDAYSYYISARFPDGSVQDVKGVLLLIR